jgi:DNA repair protein RadA/Sms
LAILLAIISSLRNKPLPHDLMVFGEVGLAGEIRPVQSGQERIREAAKQGFKRVIIPKTNASKASSFENIEILPVTSLKEALEFIKP